ncbi:hypothetical protein HYT56_00595 [Candidatus Woesearchaeota archaeon]|nr:hypothetical protein [Candidatus Woesearchaeota archaeon]
MKQETYILDTNVYGELLIEENSEKVIENIEKDKSLYIYGIDVIEKELQDVPSDKKIKGKIFRQTVLSTYKSLIDEEITVSPIAKYLASQYYKNYIKIRKIRKYASIKEKETNYTEEDLKSDFQIIAIASLKNVDIVVSADKRTMLSDISKKTYDTINKINNLRTPKLIDYFNFIERYTK